MPSFQKPLALETRVVGSGWRLLQGTEERLCTELVGSLAPAGFKAAGVDLAAAQEASAAFPVPVRGRDSEGMALPLL